MLLINSISISLFAQKEQNPIQNFKSPFKSKADDKISNSNKSIGKQGDFKIETVKGSFGVSIEKYNFTKEQIEKNFKNYLNLSANHSFKKIKESTDDLGFVHISYQQLFNNIPVDGAMILLHFKNGKPTSINGQIADIKNLETNAVISSAKALEIAKQFTKVTELISSYPIELLITQIPSENGFTQKLAYKVRIDASKPFTMCNVFVDAINGQVVNKISLITDVDVTANANTLYSGTQSITTDSYAGGYRLRDNARKIETYDATNATGITVLGGFVGSTDYFNLTTTWAGVPRLNSFTITSVAPNWWFTALADELADLYIKIKDGSNQTVYTASYINNTNPPVTFSNLNIVLTNPPYTVEIWDYDAVGGDDFGGSYSLISTTGTQSWSGNGNFGSYVIGSSNNPALDVHWGMEKTYDFYKNVFNRNSYDGNGSEIKQYVNPLFMNGTSGYPNNASALSSPYNIMSYGMGDGVNYKPLVGLDVEGHEFTHLVVNNNGNGGLTYQGESGALNESFADIFGTCVEFYSGAANPDWLIGEDVMIGQPFMRSMSNPNAASNPDTYNGLHWVNPTNLSYDNGGVHINSGVQNFWFYLLCQGGSGTNDLGNAYSVTGIGINQARQIAYKNLTTYIGGANSTYQDAYNGSLLAAQDLYGNPSAQYTAVKNAWYAVGIGNNPNSFCSGTTNLTTTSGSFTDGSGLANYNNNQNCKWVIAPTGATQITLNFTSFATEANYDTVFVYNGPNENYPVLLTWWGSTLPSTVSTSVGTGAMCVRFKTDNTNTAAGWAANYTSTGITPSCNGGNVLATPTGSFTDGSGSSNYGNNQTCYWLIAPPCATGVTLNISQLNTEAGYDGLVVYNGSSTSSPLLGTYSGTTLPSAITASSGQMLVVFTSDFSTTGQGFAASYTSTGSAYCSGTTTLNTADYGTITDGSGANNYCNNQNCSWLIQPPQATSVTLNFSSFDVEAASTDGNNIYDAVEVYNGTTTSAPLLGRFSGNNIPPSLTASSGSMLVRFFSDVSVTKTGWSAYYTSTSPSFCNASTTLTTSSGTFSDGSGADKYANNSNCSWLIQPTGANSITLSFSAFNTEAGYDGVIVHNGSNASAPVLGTFSGTTIPTPVTANSGSMFVRFLSDEALRSDGWVANYTSTSLPLSLIDFKASLLGKEVSLNWSTSNEVNTKEFKIEKSIDGNSWSELGAVVALNSSGINNYSFKDIQPIIGINYYRLKMIDRDNKFNYSPVRLVNLSKSLNSFTIAPNPASSFVTIYFNSTIKTAEINVFDALGKIVLSQSLNGLVISSYRLNTDKLGSGVYIISIKTDSNISNDKLIISR